MPLRPVHRDSGLAKSYPQYTPEELKSHALASWRELGGFMGFSHPVNPRLVDAANVRRSIGFLQALPSELVDADTVCAESDLADLIERIEEKPAAKARA